MKVDDLTLVISKLTDIKENLIEIFLTSITKKLTKKNVTQPTLEVLYLSDFSQIIFSTRISRADIDISDIQYYRIGEALISIAEYKIKTKGSFRFNNFMIKNPPKHLLSKIPDVYDLPDVPKFLRRRYGGESGETPPGYQVKDTKKGKE